jgi:PTH1 family peptidyl-tRNA hydrolase
MPEDPSSLIVGLGNPGDEYRLTRHNLGFMVVDRLAKIHQIPLRRSEFEVLFGCGRVGKRPVALAKPMTFMNRVGPAISNLGRLFALDLQDILVIHDDIDILFGKIKIKEKGGDGGHNGVKSLISAWGSDTFTRVRVGIGRPQNRQDISSSVLQRFDTEQERRLSDVISTAQDAVETVLFKGVSEAMNRFHGKTISESNVGRRL